MQVLSEPFTSLDAYLEWAKTRPDWEVLVEVVDGCPIVAAMQILTDRPRRCRARS